MRFSVITSLIVAYLTASSAIAVEKRQNCVSVYGQCGGQYYTGSTCCVSGSVCTYASNWYSQCKPGVASSPSPSPAASPKTSPSPSPRVSPSPSPRVSPSPSTIVSPSPSSSTPNFQVSSLLTSSNTKFGTYIEGAAGDISGNAYAVNFGSNSQTQTFGRINLSTSPPTQSQMLSYESVTQFNGIRVVCDNGSSRTFLVADKQNKRVIKVVESNGSTTASVFCSSSGMLVGTPNDLAIDYTNQRVYLSGQVYNSQSTAADGEIWMCTKDGVATKLSDTSSLLGRTNGIELSMDEKTLYVSETLNSGGGPSTAKIVSFSLNSDGTLNKSSRKVFYDFASDGTKTVDPDGMRLDVAGNLYVSRNGGGHIAMLNSSGQLVRKITLPGTNYPTNFEMVGNDGKTAIAVGRCGSAAYGSGVGCVDTFTVPYAGRAWQELTNRKSNSCPW